MLYPEALRLDCETCKAYCLDLKTGKVMTNHAGEPIKRRGGPPCDQDKTACPKGHHSDPAGLDDLSYQIWQHYRECRAVGQFPDDPIVRRHAATIRRVEDEVERVEQMRLLARLIR